MIELTITVSDMVGFLIKIVIALLLGSLIALTCKYKSEFNSSLTLTIAILPAIISVVVMVVSGDIGVGIAVAGAFSLVRFRSAPGTAREIVMIFLSMATGLLIGMELEEYAVIFALFMCFILMVYTVVLSKTKDTREAKVLRIVIPEDLDYASEMDSVIGKFASSKELVSVKTSNMGTLFVLKYNIIIEEDKEKSLIDEIRVRNGNLEVAIVKKETDDYRL